MSFTWVRHSGTGNAAGLVYGNRENASLFSVLGERVPTLPIVYSCDSHVDQPFGCPRRGGSRSTGQHAFGIGNITALALVGVFAHVEECLQRFQSEDCGLCSLGQYLESAGSVGTKWKIWGARGLSAFVNLPQIVWGPHRCLSYIQRTGMAWGWRRTMSGT